LRIRKSIEVFLELSMRGYMLGRMDYFAFFPRAGTYTIRFDVTGKNLKKVTRDLRVILAKD